MSCVKEIGYSVSVCVIVRVNYCIPRLLFASGLGFLGADGFWGFKVFMVLGF